METHRKETRLRKLDCGYQWRPTGKKIALDEMCHLTKISVKCHTGHALVSGLRLFKTYDGKSFKAHEFCGKVHRFRSAPFVLISIDEMRSLLDMLAVPKLPSPIHGLLASSKMITFALPVNLEKASSSSTPPKSENTNMESVFHLTFTWSVWSMRVQSINGKKYILVIVDDYSRFTWVKFLRLKDEISEFVINFLKQIQVGLNKTVRYIRTDNGTEFVNQVMSKYYEGVGIFHQKSVPRTPQQNGVVERRNRTLVEAARTMLIFSKAPMFLWAEVVATACYTQNRSLIHTRHNKTPYELVHDKKPDLTFLRVFGALCYPTNDSEDLGKLQAKADIGIFVGYAPSRKGF
ncbi:retrovirus-related pol polyprotein from transposon TNT 1-94 [Tanacetum coccineum]|uniref:Retrovirus-related pol polyprotein from transposon TNT 1-94 n=1 Tax=Tanacetum coccineum TaxID=301880 RepID=A0ABQ5BEB3_9ASTR